MSVVSLKVDGYEVKMQYGFEFGYKPEYLRKSRSNERTIQVSFQGRVK